MRQLATVRRISELLPIEGADLIVTAVIDDWSVVVKKDEFKVGGLCVYCEIDSFLPDGHPAWQHLVEKHPRMFDGGRGHRLKTVRLRGQISQGFAAPVDAFFSDFYGSKEDEGQELSEFFLPGTNLTELLKIKKYEAPVPSELSGQVKGNFPLFIPKTDQERCQNLGVDIFLNNPDAVYEVTLKLDGTSFTGYHNNDVTGVCGRNWDLSLDKLNEHNSLVRMFIDSGLQQVLYKYGRNLAVQAELMGPGIQRNREGFTSNKLFIFDIYDIDNACYMPPEERRALVEELFVFGLDRHMVSHVPVIAYSANLLDTLGIKTVQDLLKYAEGKSINHLIREGLVFKRLDGKFSFKAISNLFLLKEKD
jgi:RNA ligase (TIGR02306 family)